MVSGKLNQAQIKYFKLFQIVFEARSGTKALGNIPVFPCKNANEQHVLFPFNALRAINHEIRYVI